MLAKVSSSQRPGMSVLDHWASTDYAHDRSLKHGVCLYCEEECRKEPACMAATDARFALGGIVALVLLTVLPMSASWPANVADLVKDINVGQTPPAGSNPQTMT